MVFKFEHPENRHQRYYARHREEIKIQQRERKRNMTKEELEEKRTYEREYTKTEKFKNHRHDYYQKLIEELKIKIFELFDGKCSNPYSQHDKSYTDVRALQIDHINGGGRQQRKMMNSTERFYKYVLSHPEEFQLLCANCNQIKRVENKEN